MAFIKGIPVLLRVKTPAGVDAFNRPITSDETVTVENVLVCEPSTEDQASAENVTGRRIDYVLCIPKDDTHVWENTVVEFFGASFRTVGFPLQFMEQLLPLAWNKKVKVRRNE